MAEHQEKRFTHDEIWNLIRMMAENDKRRHYSLPTLTDTDIENYTAKLKLNWKDIVGEDLSKVTKPLAITGKKSRRLIVVVSPDYKPPPLANNNLPSQLDNAHLQLIQFLGKCAHT